MLAIAARLGLPVLLVVGIRLGCLNHGLLTAQAIRHAASRSPAGQPTGSNPAMQEADANVATLVRILPCPTDRRFPLTSAGGARPRFAAPHAVLRLAGDAPPPACARARGRAKGAQACSPGYLIHANILAFSARPGT